VILIDAGPLVALFDPRDGQHAECALTLSKIEDRLVTTTPVMTEAFHLLEPGTRGAALLQRYIRDAGLSFWTLDDERLLRAIDIMEHYADQAMDLADATLVAAAETLRVTTIFTLDRKEFVTYRPRIGRTLSRFHIL
jgi:uncharacterized protein